MKASTPPQPPPCSVCGMPWDLTGTRAHRHWHRELARQQKPKRNRELEARAWLRRLGRIQ